MGTARKLTKFIIWHCTATPEGREVKYEDLYQWHVRENGWSDIGYHYLIQLDGTRVTCRPEELVGAHCRGYGHNYDSIGIVYAGGVTNDGRMSPKDTRTPEQISAMYSLTQELLSKYGLRWQDVHGHNEYAAKACPSFDVQKDIDGRLDKGGNLEELDPDMGAYGLAIKALAARVEALERWRKS